MSVLDAFFNKGFKAAKCKTLLKLTIPRIKLLRNKRENQLKQMRRDIAKLLENGQEATARIRVEHIIREENMMAAQEIIELFCELIAVRLPIIETQRECPLDLKEAISSVCFAAPRCSDLTELQQVQLLFAAKYGREFVAAASELLPDCGVNRQIIELLSVRAPSVEARLKLLKEIAEEHEVEWDPAASETEFLKPHEDLLNGPSPALPLPEEKHEDLTSSFTQNHHEIERKEAESDEDFEFLNLPEVPKAAVQPTSETSSVNDSDHIRFEPSKYSTDEFGNPNTTSLTMKEIKQFQYVPFVASPPPPPAPSYLSPTTEKTESSPPFQPPHFPSSSDNSEPSPFSSNYSLPLEKNDSSALSQSVPKQSEIRKGTDTSNIDLQDVLAAAQAAADSADQAAQSARAAASLAQLRIAEIVRKQNLNSASEAKEEEEKVNTTEEPSFDQQHSFEYNHMPKFSYPSYDDKKDYMHQPQRSVSLEDDPYFSYPNLFNRQNSEVSKLDESSPDEHSSFSK